MSPRLDQEKRYEFLTKQQYPPYHCVRCYPPEGALGPFFVHEGEYCHFVTHKGLAYLRPCRDFHSRFLVGRFTHKPLASLPRET